MFATLSLWVALAVGSHISAFLGQDGQLHVKSGKTGFVLSERSITADHPSSLPSQVGEHSVRIRGRTLREDGGKVVDIQSGNGVDLLKSVGTPNHGGIPRLNGAHVCGERTLWLFEWCTGDYVGEPVVAVCAYIVELKEQKPVLSRLVDLSSIAGGMYGVNVVRQKDVLLIQNNSDHSAVSALLDLKTGRHVVTPSTGIVLSDSGRAFRQDASRLREWDWDRFEWSNLSRLHGHRWRLAFGLGDDDLLVAEGCLALARKGNVYIIPSPNVGFGYFSLYLDHHIGVGVTWLDSNQDTKGVLLDAKELRVLCRIRTTASK
jgi:hypothetical protein